MMCMQDQNFQRAADYEGLLAAATQLAISYGAFVSILFSGGKKLQLKY